MKLVLVGDLHLTLALNARMDNIWETQCTKLAEIRQICKREKARGILFTGDIFHQAQATPELIAEVCEQFQLFQEVVGDNVMVVLGQHDMYLRSGLQKSPVRVLATNGLVTILTHKQYTLEQYALAPKYGSFVHLYGADFGKDIPTPANPSQAPTNRRGLCNILVMHELLHPDKLFPADELFTKPADFMKQHVDFDLILCGDYHVPYAYSTRNKKQHIINPGSLTRTARDQTHHPAVVLFDTTTKETKTIELTVLPSKKVFPRTVTVKPEREHLSGLMDLLAQDQAKGLAFKDVLLAVMKKKRLRTDVKEIILGALEDVETA